MTATANTSGNCIDMVRPLIDELRQQELLDGFQLMGGICSAALKHAGTVILPVERRIVTSPDFTVDNPDLSRFRENGTLRDMDALVLTSDPDTVSSVEAVATSLLTNKQGKKLLDVSIFGLRDLAYLEHQKRSAFGVKAFKTFVSDRFAGEDGSMFKALFPFSVPLSRAAIEGWMLEIGGEEYPVQGPAAAVANYLTRSITGLRPKDQEKVEEMVGHMHSIWPEMADWLIDGPGQSQMQLAGVFQTLRHGDYWRPNKKPPLKVGGVLELPTGAVSDLLEHDAFMLRDAASDIQQEALFWAQAKSRGVGVPESNPTIVRLFQLIAERHIGSITKNR